MAISEDTINEHLNDPAAFCCIFEAGSTIGPAQLIDPEIFEEMIDAGLMKLDENVLKIGQVLGKTLAKNTASLQSATVDMIVEPITDDAPAAEEEVAVAPEVAVVAPVAAPMVSVGGMAKLYIEEGKGISIEFPL